MSTLARPRSALLRASLFALAVLATVLGAPTRIALAAGGFSLKTPKITEKNGEWHVKVKIEMTHAPAMMHVPMRFTFSKEAVDERAIMSKGAEPVHHRMVLDTEPKQIVSLDVDFADASGKVYRSTYFEFDLERASGFFEAGEYSVSLSGPDGEVGGSQKLVLEGDNPPVYRGAMEFDTAKPGKKKGPKIEAVGNDTGDGGAPASDDQAANAAAPTSTDVAPTGSAPSMVPDNAYNKTKEEESVQDHPSGCGCKVVGSRASGTAAFGLATAGLAAVVARRRRSRSRTGGRAGA